MYQVFSRLLAFLSLIGIVLGLAPATVTVCLCTGEQVSGPVANAVCPMSREGCPFCVQKLLAKKATQSCFVSQGKASSQTPNLAAHFSHDVVAVLLDRPLITFGSPLAQPLGAHEFALPPIRGPDREQPHLRGPPSLG